MVDEKGDHKRNGPCWTLRVLYTKRSRHCERVQSSWQGAPEESLYEGTCGPGMYGIVNVAQPLSREEEQTPCV